MFQIDIRRICIRNINNSLGSDNVVLIYLTHIIELRKIFMAFVKIYLHFGDGALSHNATISVSGIDHSGKISSLLKKMIDGQTIRSKIDFN